MIESTVLENSTIKNTQNCILYSDCPIMNYTICLLQCNGESISISCYNSGGERHLGRNSNYEIKDYNEADLIT